MRNRELERIATILVTTEATYDDVESLDEEVVTRVWKYLLDCGIDPEDFRPSVVPVEVMPVPEVTKQFVIGSEVSCRSLGDYECVFRFTVLKRTAKFVTLRYHGTEHRVALRTWSDGAEYCYPLGTYSMAPMLKAGEIIS